MDKAYVIRISSQKGGVGKTTIAVNLAVSLGMLHYRVLLVDADTITPSVGFLLGLEEVNSGIREVIEKRIALRNAVIRHAPSGISVLPGTLALGRNPNEEEKMELLDEVINLNYYDFIIVDTSPGYYFENMSKVYDEAMIISTTSMSSIASAIRFGKIYDNERIKHTMVLNRISDVENAGVEEIEAGVSQKMMAVLPEDPNVAKSEEIHIPVYIAHRNSPFCLGLRKLTMFYAAKRGTNESVYSTERAGLLSKIRHVFAGIISRLHRKSG